MSKSSEKVLQESVEKICQETVEMIVGHVEASKEEIEGLCEVTEAISRQYKVFAKDIQRVTRFHLTIQSKWYSLMPCMQQIDQLCNNIDELEKTIEELDGCIGGLEVRWQRLKEASAQSKTEK
uniref:Biogenesis of lysosome-related organelles complex 1 subunit 2 n=1 Tax=Fibrocapsa japonica TaxID=94617 RepID=A0A7S2UWH9_9STRA|mmetsp:Transcript_13857/g.20423  ORF Transcript_13857/g.20423 Transcript_13857/m.20423 type:complete len:123 (+) Transcript_13857:132-500(+)